MTIRESRARLRAAEQAYNTAKPGRDLTEARHELTAARAEYQAACVDLVGMLEAALEAFHIEASEWAVSTGDDHEVYVSSDEYSTGHAPSPIVFGDLRRLSSIYKEIADAE